MILQLRHRREPSRRAPPSQPRRASGSAPSPRAHLRAPRPRTRRPRSRRRRGRRSRPDSRSRRGRARFHPRAVASIRSAGPLIARPPISGLTATDGTRRRSTAARTSSTARIGQMLMNGLLGQTTIRSACSIASTTPDAGVASSSPSKRTRSTSSVWRRATNHSWNGNEPSGVSIQVRRRSSVAGSSRASTPNAAASRAVTAESGSPAASAWLRTRCSPRSRSPSMNQLSPPSRAASSKAVQVSSARPHPRWSSATPASA